MKHWNDAIPALEEVMARHFPGSEPESVEAWVNEIYNAASAAASLERLERNDKPAGADIEHLKVAAKNLKTAAGRLEKLGYHGNASLLEFAKDIRKIRYGDPSQPLMDTMDAGNSMSSIVREIAARLSACAEDIDARAETVMAGLGDTGAAELSRGRPAGTEAYFTARAAYGAFEALSGKVPTVSTSTPKKPGSKATKTASHKEGENLASGPFLGFLADVFECMGVKASAETWARKARREKIAGKW